MNDRIIVSMSQLRWFVFVGCWLWAIIYCPLVVRFWVIDFLYPYTHYQYFHIFYNSIHLLIFVHIMLQEDLKKYIEDQHLFNRESRLLLAVSGGGDSMAMLHLLCNEGYYCEVAHVNFQLRGDDSKRDADLVTSVCKNKKLVLHNKTVDTRQYATDHKLSVEMAAREIRYAFFEEIMNKHKLDCVVVAHHRNDVVETFFINLMRGTGLRGLSGIAPKNGRIVRPLLAVSHQELIAYLDERELDYCIDKTNFDTTILRNEIRHHIIPELEDKKPGFTEIMQRTIGRLRESESVVDAYIKEWKEQYVKEKAGDLFIPMSDLYASVSSSEILFHLLQPLGFSVAVIDELSNAVERRTGACYESGDYRLVIDRQNIIISKMVDYRDVYSIERGEAQVLQPLPLKMSYHKKDDTFVLKKDSLIALLDADLLTFPLTLRRWQEGDVFCPIGMRGKQKKVSDYFIDKKLSIPEKEKVWLLCSGKEIVWIVGYRLDERYKVTEETRSVLEIDILK